MVDDNALEQDHKEEIGVDIEDISDVQLEQIEENNTTAHDDYDWSLGKRNTVKYTDCVSKKYFLESDNSINSVDD